ncbi:MAG TPA: FAD-dependent oxidoreductase, partial [Opitutales bacterium]|nr:FAD-dependent oxidoreductase [Opitutales bacterium]
IHRGAGRFVDAHTVEVTGKDGSLQITGDYVLIATGSYPFHPPGIPFDGDAIYDSDSILNLKSIPKSIVIVGAGVIGCEYATIFAAMGAKVILVNSHGGILPWLDREVADALVKYMGLEGIHFVTDVRLEQVTVHENAQKIVKAHLNNGEQIEAEVFLYAAGRCGNVKNLNLAAVNIGVDNRENIPVDSTYRTCVPNIYAAGDVIGFPSLASTSMACMILSV